MPSWDMTSQELRKAIRNRIRQSSRIRRTHRRQRQLPLQPMSFHAAHLELPLPLPQRVLRKNRISESGLYQALDRLRVERFHHHTRRHADLFEELVDHQPDVTLLRIKKKGNRR